MVTRLLALELWGVGDVVLAADFLRAASRRHQVCLLAKPHARSVLERLAPAVELIALTAPWTAFAGKYRLHRWPLGVLARCLGELRSRRFDVALSARPDPRDHLLMGLSGAGRRLGFPRAGSRPLLTDALPLPAASHRRMAWAQLAEALGFELAAGPSAPPPGARGVVVHTGAAQPVRVWPLAHYAALCGVLRGRGCEPTLLCDPGQGEALAALGERPRSAASLPELMTLLEGARAFVGNDSGPGHLAAALGVPTFTIFGPQLPALFAPVHASADWIEGRACAYKPCFDSCHYARPHCIEDLGAAEVAERVLGFLERVDALDGAA